MGAWGDGAWVVVNELCGKGTEMVGNGGGGGSWLVERKEMVVVVLDVVVGVYVDGRSSEGQ